MKLKRSRQQLIQTDTVRILTDSVNRLLRWLLLIRREEPMAVAKKKTARGRKQDRARVAGGQRMKWYESTKHSTVGVSG